MLRASRSFINLAIKNIRVGSLLVLLCIGHATAIEEPKYDVIQTDGSFEIRKYAPILIAETFVDGDMDEASSKGFRLIADFIFGNNQVTDSNASSKIAMTAPVTAEPVSKNLQYFQKKLSVPYAFQVAVEEDYSETNCFEMPRAPFAISAKTFLSQLV